jgi:flagellar biosynthesis anti-sigma factor FlgM
MTIGPITTVASNISPESSPSQVRERSAQQPVEQTEVNTTLTTDFTSLRSLVAQAMETGGTQQHSVDALRTAISSGNYPIDTSQVAISMLKELG